MALKLGLPLESEKGDAIVTCKYEEILAYARAVKEHYPEIEEEDLKKALEARFVGGKDVLEFASHGIISNPQGDYLAILSIIYNSLRKVVTQDKQKLLDIQDKINRAAAELFIVK